MRLIFLFGLIFVLFLGSCASIVSSNQSNTYVETKPENAECELQGQDFTRVINTPNSIFLPAKAAPITVVCRCDGYFTSTQELDTKMDGWILGNAIFGGMVGLMIDAFRGAGQKYPPRITILLDPHSFQTQEERDEWYDNRRNNAIIKWDDIIYRIKGNCTDKKDQDDNIYKNAQPDCESAILKAEKHKEAELQLIEERRLKSTIGAEVSQLTQ